jgi:hypothetical protein
VFLARISSDYALRDSGTPGYEAQSMGGALLVSVDIIVRQALLLFEIVSYSEVTRVTSVFLPITSIEF